MSSNALVSAHGGGGHGHGHHGGGGGNQSVGGGRSNSVVSISTGRPTTAARNGGGGAASGRQVITCNRCVKPLATTCYLTKCDCVFCEECTFAHFSESSNCYRCKKVLGEQDFTELVVADAVAGGRSSEYAQASYQALFANKSKDGDVPYQALCQSLLQQCDAMRNSVKFVLKQLIIDGARRGQRSNQMVQQQRQRDQEVMRLKQALNSQRLKYEAGQRDMHHRLRASEAKNLAMQKTDKEKDNIIRQFQQQLGSRVPGGVGGGGGSVGGRPSMSSVNQVPPSDGSNRMIPSSRMGTGRPAGGGGPINAFVGQRAQERAAQEAMMQQRKSLPLASSQSRRGGGSIGGSAGGAMQPPKGAAPMARHSVGAIHHGPGYGAAPPGTGVGMGMGGGAGPRQPLVQQHRPFSNNSNRAPPTPGNRVRDFSTLNYQFSSSSGGGERANKRRRVPPRSGGSNAGSVGSHDTFNLGMTPGTSQFMTHGPHTMRR